MLVLAALAGIQIKIPISIVNCNQLTSSASAYQKTVETLTLPCSELRDTHGVPGQELREGRLLCPALAVHHRTPCPTT